MMKMEEEFDDVIMNQLKDRCLFSLKLSIQPPSFRRPNLHEPTLLSILIQPKKSGRISNASKNHSSSRNKIPKKQPTILKQKISHDILKTQGPTKQKKSKSQCISQNPSKERRSIDLGKFVQTTRSTGRSRKSREKTEKIGRPFQQMYTEDRARHDSYLISNLTTEKSAELKWAKKVSLKKVTQGQSVQKKRAVWNEKQAPYDWQHIIEHYSHYLTKYEQGEIKQYKKIYYVGHKAAKREQIGNNSPCFDNQDKEYKYVQNDHIAYRYELLSIIGKGSYGQVFKAFDHKHKEQVALKIIKNEAKFSKQAFVEIKILSHIKQVDQEQKQNIVRIKDFVIFRKHVCIVFQLLSDNLYELIVRNNYNGLNQELIRRFAIQILVSLEFLRKQKIIHCDLKPQNILLKEYNKSGIKMIDFGSSCFENETVYTYIQSRYYRAPEITLGIPYGHFIDTWSTGCILAELFTGVPVFPGENEFEQMKYMIDTLGMPPRAMLQRGSRRSVFFDEDGHANSSVRATSTTLDIFSKPLKDRIQDADFLDFVESFLKWVPQQRITPRAALSHPWIKKGLPQQLKNQLGVSSLMMKKQPSSKVNFKRMKSKSKQKGSSTVKLSTKASQQRLKKSYGLKF